MFLLYYSIMQYIFDRLIEIMAKLITMDRPEKNIFIAYYNNNIIEKNNFQIKIKGCLAYFYLIGYN